MRRKIVRERDSYRQRGIEKQVEKVREEKAGIEGAGDICIVKISI